MNHKALQTIRQYSLIEQGDRVCVALSGGADSVALLAFLWENRRRLGLAHLFACHLNHGLRGLESKRDADFARALCYSLDIPLMQEEAQVAILAQVWGMGLEEAGREARYRMFQRIALEGDCKIATAHTLSDSMETMVFHLARGTGIAGLRGIPPMRSFPQGGVVVRPLIACTRGDVETYCATRRLPYMRDSTNEDVQFARNRIRRQVLPQLAAISPALEGSLSQLMQEAGELQEVLERMGKAAQTLCKRRGGYDKNEAAQLPPPILRALLQRLCGEWDHSLSKSQLLLCQEFVHKGGQVQLGQGLTFICRGNRFWFADPRVSDWLYDKVCIDFAGEQGEETLPGLPQKVLQWKRLICEQNKNFENNKNTSFKNTLDCGRICGIVTLRTRLPGDAYHPVGRGCGKTLKKLLGEGDLSQREKRDLFVLADEQGIVWVEGFGVDERVAVTPHSREQILLETLGGTGQ